jgi:hypothetical protein
MSRYTHHRTGGLWLPNREIVRLRNPRAAAAGFPLPAPRACRGYKPGSVLLGCGGAGNADLLSILTSLGQTANLEFALDAGAAASYGGSGASWLDLSGGGHDWYRGTDGSAQASDPTFNGTAGALSANEYWSFDGGDLFTYDSPTPAAWEAWHKNNAAFTLMAWTWRTAAGGAYFGTWGGSALTGFEWSDGANNGTQRLHVGNGGATVLQVTTSAASSTSAWHMRAVSVDEAAGGGGGFMYLDGAYDQVSGANTWDASYSSPSSANSTGPDCIGARGSGSAHVPNGTRIAMVAAWRRPLAKSDLDAIWTATRGRFGV